MAENLKAMKEMCTAIMNLLDRQFEAHRQFTKEREDTILEQFERMFESQMRHNTETIGMLSSELEKMRVEREIARATTILKLPNYDGANLEVDEWQDRCEAVFICNKWNVNNLLAAIPASLSGSAKRAFDSLLDKDKETKDVFFTCMRQKIDPQSVGKNKELFIS